MSYDDNQIIDIIDDINKTIFLPDIQREFVWAPEQIEKLFDSIMCKFPIGSFLFWKIRDDNKKDWSVYKFLEKYDAEIPHNEAANVSSIHKDINLVLDGQQRLTSLLIGLKGSYRHYYFKWREMRLFLNLLKKPVKSDDPDELTYQFKFKEPAEVVNDNDNYWLEVRKILNFKEPADLKESLEKDLVGYTRDQTKTAESIIEKFYYYFFANKLINSFEVKDRDYDDVIEIFVRTNTGGKKLEYSDILLSKATAKWKHHNAKEELNNFTDNINKIGEEYRLSKDFVLKGCMYLTDSLPIQYKVKNFTKDNLEKIEDNWSNIKRYIEDCILLISRFGLINKNIISTGALLPISYYLMKIKKKNYVNSTINDDVKNQSNIMIWLVLSFLKNVFGGSSDTVLTNTRNAIDKAKNLSTFPYMDINRELGVESRLIDIEIDKLIKTGYKTKYSFLILSLLYPGRDWKDKIFHEDHIYPKSEFTKAKLTKRGYDEIKIEKYQKYYNSILNLQLLEDSENLRKKATDFDLWIKSRDTNFKERHSIPDINNYEFDNFLHFIEERKKIIINKLNNITFY